MRWRSPVMGAEPAFYRTPVSGYIEREFYIVNKKNNFLYIDINKRILKLLDDKYITKDIQNFYKNEAINLIIKDQSEITLLTINGYIKITRNVLIPADSNSLERLKELYGAEIKSIVPLDMFLGIWNMPFKVTPAMMLVISHTAISQCSYQKTEECIESLKKIKIGDDTIRKIVNYIGKIVFEKECKIADKNIEDDKFGKFPKNYNIDGVLYAEADGCFLFTQNLVTKKKNGEK